MIFCTLFDSNYMDKGLALCRSLERHVREYSLYIFCFDDKAYEILQDLHMAHVIPVHCSEIEDSKLLALKKKRSRAEYCWTCTPITIEYVLNHFMVEHCVYIDADIYFFSDVCMLSAEIEQSGANIVIVEHRFGTNPWRKRWEKKSGKYCVEFNYFDQSGNSRKALGWWKERCLEWCYALYEPERMGDQKYLEKFPELFEGVHELQHLGGGVAPWNLYQYKLKPNKKRLVLVEKKTGKAFPLVFFHFQNIRYLPGGKVNINSGVRDKELKRAIYFPYLCEIEGCRKMLGQKYGLHFDIRKSCSSNKIKAFIQRNIMCFKIARLSDVIRLDEMRCDEPELLY